MSNRLARIVAVERLIANENSDEPLSLYRVSVLVNSGCANCAAHTNTWQPNTLRGCSIEFFPRNELGAPEISCLGKPGLAAGDHVDLYLPEAGAEWLPMAVAIYGIPLLCLFSATAFGAYLPIWAGVPSWSSPASAVGFAAGLLGGLIAWRFSGRLTYCLDAAKRCTSNARVIGKTVPQERIRRM